MDNVKENENVTLNCVILNSNCQNNIENLNCDCEKINSDCEKENVNNDNLSLKYENLNDDNDNENKNINNENLNLNCNNLNSNDKNLSNDNENKSINSDNLNLNCKNLNSNDNKNTNNSNQNCIDLSLDCEQNNIDYENDGSSESEMDDDLINELCEKARSNIIPEKSKKLYEQQYSKFKDWCSKLKVKEINDKIILAYFETLSKKYKASSLWAIYSRIKPMILLKESKDISKNIELMCFLKRKEKLHTVKKSKVFTKQEVSTFIETAPDDEYLLHKVVLIMGLYGCLRTIELLNIKIHDIRKEGNLYCVSIPETKTGVKKSFVTHEEASPIISKYLQLRPENMEKFLLQFRNKKCIRQNVGKNKISTMPKDIAEFLKLDDPELYTGHAFRRTSATILVDEGADILTLKRHGEWKSNSVAEGYINQSIANKIKTSSIISNSIHLPKTVTTEILPIMQCKKKQILTQEELQELKKVKQDEIDEILNTQFSPPKKVKKDEIDDLLNTQFSLQKKGKKKEFSVSKSRCRRRNHPSRTKRSNK